MAFATLAQLKLHLDISDSTKDSLLQQLLDIALTAVANYIPTYAEQATLTEYYDGNGQVDMPLRIRPVNLSVTPQVWQDTSGNYGIPATAFPSITALTYGSDFAIVPDGPVPGHAQSALLRRLGLGLAVDVIGRPYGSLATRYRQACWPTGQGNVKVTYKAGWATVPADVTGSVLDIAALIYRTRLFGGNLASERLGEYSYTIVAALHGQGALANNLATAQGMLAPYRELTI